MDLNEKQGRIMIMNITIQSSINFTNYMVSNLTIWEKA